MQCFLLLLCICAGGSAIGSLNHVARLLPTTSESELVEGTYSVPLDHFNSLESQRLLLDYQSNAKYFKRGSPIFVNANNLQGNVWIKTGLIHDLAESMNALLIASDLRFIGRNARRYL